jgi:hypothetical protein
MDGENEEFEMQDLKTNRSGAKSLKVEGNKDGLNKDFDFN